MITKNKKLRPGQSGEDGCTELRLRRYEIIFAESEFEKLKKKYEKSGQSTMAKYCRQVLLETKSGLTAKEIKVNSYADTYALNKIGNNINQIARRINSLKSDYPELIEDLRFEIENLRILRIRDGRLVGKKWY